jgi:transposase
MSLLELKIMGKRYKMHSIRMSEKELKKVEILQLVNLGNLKRKEAAELLKICLRQLDRLRRVLRSSGPKGLAHGNRGRKSNNKLKEEIRSEVLVLVKKHYIGFGPTLAAEKLLKDHGLKISKEKLRQLMKEEGLWEARKRKRNKYHPRRPRRSHWGDLLQGDGSHHDWFETRGDPCVLVAVIDDATNKAYGLFFDGETTEAYVTVMRKYFEKYGKPRSLYVDKDSIFRVNKVGAIKTTGDTQFSRMMKELDITLICAHSPEAKGRIERLFGTLQDRLVKEMRLLNIANIVDANNYLETEFWEEFNQRWSLSPKNPENYHRISPSRCILDRVFTLREKRIVSKSLDFSYQGILYQIMTKSPNRLVKKNIEIFEGFNGSLWAEFNGEKLDIKPFKDIPKMAPIEDSKTINSFINKRAPLTTLEKHRRGIGYPR